MAREEEDAGSLDMLLDTLCNTFGGIILIALLLALSVNEKSQELYDEIVKTDDNRSDLIEQRNQLRNSLLDLEDEQAEDKRTSSSMISASPSVVRAGLEGAAQASAVNTRRPSSPAEIILGAAGGLTHLGMRWTPFRSLSTGSFAAFEKLLRNEPYCVGLPGTTDDNIDSASISRAHDDDGGNSTTNTSDNADGASITEHGSRARFVHTARCTSNYAAHEAVNIAHAYRLYCTVSVSRSLHT